jgi:DNA-binding CsgD family transcriptional regulator
MSHFIRFTLPLLLCLSFLGCSHTADKLNTAEQLMETAPDSALHILQKLKLSLFTSRSDKALYALLLSHALDKNDIKVESDSLISVATKYYDEKDPIRAGYAWFYMARCANNRGDAQVQADALLKAQDFAEKAENDKLLGFVYGDKADMYTKQQQLDSVIRYKKISYAIFKKGKNNYNSVISLLNIGYAYLNKQQLDSAIVYFGIAKDLSVKIKDTLLNSTIYRSLGAVYYKKGDTAKALYYLNNTPFTNIALYDSNIWYLKAMIFIQIGNFDSIYACLNKIKHPNEIALDYYRLWQSYYEKQGNFQKALNYANRITQAKDSLSEHSLSMSFAGLEKKYKYLSLQLSNKQLVIQNKQNNILLLIVLFLMSLGAAIVLFWRNRVKNHQLKVQKQLLKQEKDLAEKEKENINLLEQQLKMQNILLSNVEQYRKQSVKRPDNHEGKRHGVSPILNQTFHEELIASMDIQYNEISKRIKNRFPDLNERDILICCLILAEFDSGMIATILDIKNDSVRIHRTRLRKKLGMQNSENFSTYLRQF